VIAVTATARCPTNPSSRRQANADGTHLHQLTPWSAMAGGVPDWSRATNLIAYRSAPEESGIGNFFTIRPDGSGLTQVTHLQDTVISHQIGFSPDGRWLVFSMAPAGGTNQLTVAAVDGSSLREVTKSTLAVSCTDWTSSDVASAP
jgi:Tol biopolymer transport system component